MVPGINKVLLATTVATAVQHALPAMGLEPFNKVFLLSKGRVLSPGSAITIDDEFSVAVFVKPAVLDGYANDYATELVMEKYDSNSHEWQIVRRLDLIPSSDSNIMTYEYMMVHNSVITNSAGDYRLTVVERFGTGDVRYFDVQSRIIIEPSPAEAAVATTNNVDIGTDILVSRPQPKPGWRFVRWWNGATSPSQWIRATVTGEALTLGGYARWCDNEPNDLDGREDWVEMVRQHDWRWNDCLPGVIRNYYILEIE